MDKEGSNVGFNSGEQECMAVKKRFKSRNHRQFSTLSNPKVVSDPGLGFFQHLFFTNLTLNCLNQIPSLNFLTSFLMNSIAGTHNPCLPNELKTFIPVSHQIASRWFLRYCTLYTQFPPPPLLFVRLRFPLFPVWELTPLKPADCPFATVGKK